MSVDLWLRNPIFAAAGQEACAELVERYPAKRYGPDRNIVTSGQALEHLHVLLEGCVRVYHQTPDGLELTVKLLRAPVVYGDLEMFHDLPFLESVATVEDSTIARIPCDDYDQFLDRYPAAMRAHMVHIAAAFCVAIRNEQQLFASLDRRIANLVMAYTQVAGKAPPLGDKPAVALSQESIARSLGVVRRSVAGVLAAWAKAGIVRKRGNYLVLEQPDVLRQLCAPIANSLPYWIGIPLEPLSQAASPEEERRASLELVEGPPSMPVGQRSTFDKELVIGGDTGCGLQLPPMDGVIAPRHCRLFRSARGGRYWVQALSSKLPTLLNDAPVTRAVLRDGDLIGLGPVRMRVVLGRA